MAPTNDQEKNTRSILQKTELMIKHLEAEVKALVETRDFNESPEKAH